MSASLDQTVRVWDISGLRKKTVAPGGDDVLRLPQVSLRLCLVPYSNQHVVCMLCSRLIKGQSCSMMTSVAFHRPACLSHSQLMLILLSVTGLCLGLSQVQLDAR